MNWLILGGNGQLGHAMKVHLNHMGCNFTVLSHQQLDILDRAEFQKYLDTIKPSVVVNCAAWTDVDLAESNESLAYLVNAVGFPHLNYCYLQNCSKVTNTVRICSG